MTRRFPLHVHISTLFIALILLIGSVIGGLGYRVSREILETTAGDLNARIGRETLSEFTNLIGPAEMAARLVSHDGVTRTGSLAERMNYVGFMRTALDNSAALTSIYVGYGDGDFFMLRRFHSPVEGQTFNAPSEAVYMAQSIERGTDGTRGSFIFFDAALKQLRSDDLPDYAMAYDPRTRGWYQAAQASAGQIKTPPYVFYTSQKVGTTIANRANNADAVVGADIRLETLDQSLARQKVTAGSHAVLANREGLTIADENLTMAIRSAAAPGGQPALPRLADLGIPVLARIGELLPTLDDAGGGRDLALTVDGVDWHASLRPVQLEGATPLYLITAIPDAELMSAAKRLMRHAALATVLVILLGIPVTWLLARAISGPLRQLARAAEAIRHFEFSQPIKVDSLVLEVNNLTLTMDSMKRTIRRFLDVTHAIADERDFDRLLPKLLTETMAAAGAEAGVLYLADNAHLRPAAALRCDGAALTAGDASVAVAACGPLLESALASHSARGGRLAAADIAALHLPVGDEATDHAIAVPLLNRSDVLVGVMLLIRAEASDPAQISFIEALSGSSAVSLESKELIKAQKMLFEAFIRLIAGAIDAKSPYTGGHCARVPELTKMLARAACAETSGPFKDFRLDDEEWEAVHIAAWLHDCGKVTTPEYVVDKATKLETLYDRIHEVRMRFEVLKRDAEIACLKAIAAGTPEASARNELARTLAGLDDDFAFIAGCNEGGEFMAPEKLERLKEIAARTWTRTLDDRIGISHEEKERKARSPAPALPVVEALLADRPEHVFERAARDRMPADNPWGFRLDVPEALYDQGELHNLGVARGTLSDEERYKINEHIVQTLIMLTQLPFPKHLRNVPEIAAGHHEKMDGTGYPRRLVRDEMSPVARMMAIADIFEALTAVDRPYKKGKTLSEAIGIMSFMKKNQHIDPELFDLFLRSGVYRDYAERFMKPEQIDAVDISAYLGGQAIPG